MADTVTNPLRCRQSPEILPPEATGTAFNRGLRHVGHVVVEGLARQFGAQRVGLVRGRSNGTDIQQLNLDYLLF